MKLFSRNIGVRSHFAWLIGGLLLGAAVGALAPHAPSYAVATDRSETFAICTGPVDDDLEAIYFLDFLTGDLRAAVVSIQTQKFAGFFEYNVVQDLPPGQTPRYAMVTGLANLRQGAGQLRPGNSLLYITEGTSGRVAAYAIPWNRNRAQSNTPYTGALVLMDGAQFRGAAVRGN